jgi:hypothetical protein
MCEKMKNQYVKPISELVPLCMSENIAASGEEETTGYYLNIDVNVHPWLRFTMDFDDPEEPETETEAP